MKLSVHERVMKLINHYFPSGSPDKQGNKAAFAKSIGSKSGTIGDIIGGRLNNPSFDILQSIVNTYPDVRLDWLVKGEDPMLYSDIVNTKTELPSMQVVNEDKPQYIIKEKIVVVTQDTSDNVTIPVVNRKAAANYLAGFQSQEYYEELPPMTMPKILMKGGQNAMFQVTNDSMEPTFFDSEYVICTKVESGDWKYINDFEVFVVISDNNGVQLKRVKNRLKTRGFMRFRSDNRQHKDFSLNEDEIRELWRFQWKLSPFAINRAEELYRKVDDMEEKVMDMEAIMAVVVKKLGINPKNITNGGK